MSNNRQSDTALFAALSRAVAQLRHEGPDTLARHFLPPHLRWLIKMAWVQRAFVNKNQALTPGAYEYLIARTAHFDRAFQHALSVPVAQLVLLGAGYDSRTLRFADALGEVKVFELDMPATQQRKEQCLRRAKLTMPDQHQFIAADFDADTLESLLTSAGFDKDRQTCFLWEGVTMYLEPESVTEVLRFVSGCADSHIVFDYVLPLTEARAAGLFGVAEFLDTWDKHRQGEPFKACFSDEGLQELIRTAGLSRLEQVNATEMHQRYLEQSQDPVTGFFRWARAS